jgi:hypothetical protein
MRIESGIPAYSSVKMAFGGGFLVSLDAIRNKTKEEKGLPPPPFKGKRSLVQHDFPKNKTEQSENKT